MHVPRRSWKLACVFGFWELCPQTPTGALSLDPAEGIPSPRPPVLSHLANFWLPLLANPVSASDLFIYYYSYMQPHYLSHAHPTRDGLSRSPATYTTGKRTTIYIRYTGWSEKASHQILVITPQNIDRFLTFFTDTPSNKFALKWLFKIPPNFKRIATVPCEILMYFEH